MDKVFRVAALQSKPQKTLDANLNQVQSLLIDASQQGARMVVLGENFAYHGQSDLHAIGKAEATPQGPVRQFLTEQSKQLGLWIIGGTVPVLEPSQSKPYARSLIYNPQGDCAGHYDKIHLFDAVVESQSDKRGYCESDFYCAGSSLTSLETDYCILALSICYDLRFAELYQQLCHTKAQLVAVPSAFTAATGVDHWQVLLRARAIENQFYVIGANLVDREHHSRALWGGSAIIDPWGKVLASLDDEIGVAVAEIDLSVLEKVRRKMPMLQHRKLTKSD